MKIEVAKPDLEAALKVASLATESNSADLTTHFVFRVRDDDQVEVYTHNNRIGISMPVASCKVESEEGSIRAFTSEAKRVSKWMSAIPAQTVVTFKVKEGDVRASTSKGFVKLQSLDPAQFPHWANTFGETSKGITIPAKRLHMALAHARLFIGDKETTQPRLAVTEISKGSLQATDKGALAVITLPELEESTLRLHYKDLGEVLGFLSSCEENIEIREHDQHLFFIRPDGGMLTAGRPSHAFPEITLETKPEHWWVLRVDELKSAVNAVVAAAANEDTRLNFNAEDGMIALSMASAASGERSVYHVEAVEMGTEENAPAMPAQGFEVAYPYLTKLLAQWRGETIRFGINPQLKKKKVEGGWVRFREDRGGDDYLTLLVWLT